MKYAAGIDVGGTNTRVALINEKYEMIKREQFSTNKEKPEETLMKIRDIIQEFGYPIEGIGISCPGPLDLINGTILTPPNLPGWHHFQLTASLEEITGTKVYLENGCDRSGKRERVCTVSDDFHRCGSRILCRRQDFPWFQRLCPGSGQFDFMEEWSIPGRFEERID